MHITLTGNLGSGKSTICKLLDSKYNYEIYSTGTVQRKLASDLGISVLEMNQLMCKDHKYDNMIDDTTAKIARENQEKNIVFDSRLAWNFVEESFKVFLSVSLDVAAARVYGDNRGEVEKYASIEDARQQLKLRAETEDKRYRDIYGVEYFDFNNYNLVLDSTYCTPELLAHVLVTEANKSEQKEKKILMSTKRLSVEPKKEYDASLPYYLDGNVTITAKDDDYVVTSGMETVLHAAEQGIPFVSVKIG